jgi:outer membrane murein-binding lipoprotein Lpp
VIPGVAGTIRFARLQTFNSQRIRKTVMTIMITQHNNIAPIASNPKGEKMLDIQTLTSQVQQLDSSFTLWSKIATGLVATTAVVATLYFIATFVANKKATQLKSAQAALARAKDEQLTLDLKEKERQIEEAKQKAAETDEKAELLKRENLRLEERLAHRRIIPAQHAKFVAALRPYAGSTVVLTKLGDSEAGRFADDLIAIFSDAGWNVNLNMSGMVSPPIYGLQCSINEQSQAGKSLATVARQLPTANIESAPQLPVVANIFVGLKPPP